ncbi:hypothetical protein P691DRAFT_651712, partial [Macrolepiota fuliginosa MF-IS2]
SETSSLPSHSYFTPSTSSKGCDFCSRPSHTFANCCTFNTAKKQAQMDTQKAR